MDVLLLCRRSKERLVHWGALLLASYLLATSSVAHAYMLKTTKTGQRVRWSSAVVALSVDQKLRDAFGVAEIQAALTIATEAWRGLDHVPDVVISDQPAPGYRTDMRTNGIYLMRPWPFAPEQLAVTVSTYDLDGRMIGADVLVNGESDYALLTDREDVSGMAQHDLAAVLTHEMGHVLGLDESPDDQTATMWPYIRGGDVHQRTLSEDDEAGIVAAYQGMVFESAGNSGCTQASVIGSSARLGPDLTVMQVTAWSMAFAWGVVRVSRRRAWAMPATLRSWLRRLARSRRRTAAAIASVAPVGLALAGAGLSEQPPPLRRS